MIEACNKGDVIFVARGDGMSQIATVDNGTATRRRVDLTPSDKVILSPLMDPHLAEDCYSSRADAQREADRRNLAGSVFRATRERDSQVATIAETMARAEDALRAAVRRARAAGVRLDVTRVREILEEVSDGNM